MVKDASGLTHQDRAALSKAMLKLGAAGKIPVGKAQTLARGVLKDGK